MLTPEQEKELREALALKDPAELEILGPLYMPAALATVDALRAAGDECVDRIRELEAERDILTAENARLQERLEAAEGWVAVQDKWPPRHQDVWCYNRDGHQFVGRICCGMHAPFFTYPRGDKDASDTCPTWIDVTHWRFLPDTPKYAATEKGGSK